MSVEQFNQRLQTARCDAALSSGFKDAHDGSRIGQQISNATPHRTAADDGNFFYFLHFALRAI